MMDVDTKENQLNSDIDDITEIILPNNNTNQRLHSILLNGDVKRKKTLPHKNRIPPVVNNMNNPGGPKSVCSLFNAVGNSEESLNEHQSEEHGQVHYSCDICKDVYTNQLQFFEHLKVHYEGRRGQTPQNEVENAMGSSFFSAAEAKAQPETGGNLGNARTESIASAPSTEAQEKLVLVCLKCQRKFKREKTYLKHILIDTCSKLLDTESEDIVVEIAKSKGKILKMNKTETDKNVQDTGMPEIVVDNDDIATGSASNTKKKHGTSQPGPKSFKCDDCQKVYNHRNSWHYHIQSHTGERSHRCEICGNGFYVKSALKVHMRVHSGEKPYKCEQCGRQFRQWSDLKYHVISIHSGIRQYQCEFCGKDFARKYSLIVHRRIHTGEKNYKCEFCGKGFRAASYLQSHRRIHTGEKPHVCTICGRPFRVCSDLKRHMASHKKESIHTHAAPQVSNTQNMQTTTNVATVSNGNQVNQIAFTIESQIIQEISQAVRNGAQTIILEGVQLTAQQEQLILEAIGKIVIIEDLPQVTPINIMLNKD